MHLKITKAGLLDSVQDLGRYGYQHQGVNPGGAMDRFAASLANALLGKELQAPVLEMHFPAAQILFDEAAVVCLTGADFLPCINGESIPLHQPIAVKKNSLLSFKEKLHGARCYLSLLNELKAEPWLNSFSSNLKAGAGGYKGRSLQKGDELSFASIVFKTEGGRDVSNSVHLPWRYNTTMELTNEIEFIPGPEWDWLTTNSQRDFLNSSFSISPASDRMGYHLQGETLEQQTEVQLVSSPVNFGTVQLLPNGQLIVLMADHQTTGGYPRIANVISAHLPKLAQRNAGENIKFSMTTVEAAAEKLVAQQKYLQQLQNTCKLKIENWLQHYSR